MPIRHHTAMAIVAVLILAVPLTASATTTHHKRHTATPVKCKTGYVRKAKIVRRHGKPHVFHWCKRSLHAKAGVELATVSKAAHSHLDPTFTQNPLNPYSTTWHYGASLSVEMTTEQGQTLHGQAELPEGTLSFFLNGSLECAINVGGYGNESGSCDVTLKQLGPQRVTTTYSSGSLSSTATEIDTVEPIPATTALSYEYEQWEEGETTSKGIRVGTLNLHLAVNPPTAESSGWVTRYPTCEPAEKPACIPIPDEKAALPRPLFDAQGNAAVPVYMEAGEVKIDAIEPGSSSAEVLWYPKAQIEDGSHYLRYESHYTSGYSGSGTTPVLGGGTQPIYITKTALAFSPEVPAIVH